MFNNLVYFIVVLLVYTTYRTSGRPMVNPASSLFSGIMLLIVFYLLARTMFRRLSRLAESGNTAGSLSISYNRLTMRVMILAVILFIFQVYFLNFKDFVLALPVIGSSTALTDLGGLLLFALYLALIWAESFEAYKVIYLGSDQPEATRAGFVLSQFRYNLPIILPWLIISLAVDALTLLPDGPFKQWIFSETGQVALYLLALGVMAVVFPVLIKYLWGLTPLPAGPGRSAIEDFCRRSNFAYSDIMLWPLNEGKALTAGVMGLFKRVRYILVTRALMEILDQDEMNAVIAHELGHVRHRHLFFYLFFFVGYMIVAYFLFDLLFFVLLANDWTASLLLSDEGRYGTAVSVLYSAPLILVMVIYFRFVLGFFMRNFERQADLFAVTVTGTIKGLVNSLEKIAYYSGQSRRVPSWHHFSIAERVEFLEQCEQQPARIAAHGRKVRRMILSYLAVLIVIGLTGYQVSLKGLGEDLNQTLALRALQARIQRVPEDARAHRLMGDLYFEKNQTGEAIVSYTRALSLNPNDPITNNNLAWLLATKKDATPLEKTRSLVLASRAAAAHPDPNVLDTLAEAYYINGRPDLALQIIERVLSSIKPKEDKTHFLEQRDKFKGAMKQGQGAGSS